MQRAALSHSAARRSDERLGANHVVMDRSLLARRRTSRPLSRAAQRCGAPRPFGTYSWMRNGRSKRSVYGRTDVSGIRAVGPEVFCRVDVSLWLRTTHTRSCDRTKLPVAGGTFLSHQRAAASRSYRRSCDSGLSPLHLEIYTHI